MVAFKSNPWIFFFSVLFLLIGIYCLIRIGVNFATLPTYPVSGVFPLLQSTYIPTSVSESSCNLNQIYYDMQGVPTTNPTVAEKAQAESSKSMCVQNIIDTRNAALLNDLGVASFFLFLGISFLLIRKFI